MFINNLTKFVRHRSCSSCTITQVLKHLARFLNDFGLPRRLVTDRGTCFTAEAFLNFCNVHDIRHTRVSTQHPPANGQLERINQVLLPMIAAYTMRGDRKKDWDMMLNEAQRCINWAPSKSTGKPPFELLYGYSPIKHGNFPRDLLPDCERRADVTELRSNAQVRLLQAQEEQQRYYNRKCSKPFKYTEGDVVVVRRKPEQNDPSKVQVKFQGPLVVTHVLPSDTYLITDLRSMGQGWRRQAGLQTTAHASQLKLFKLVEQDDVQDPDVPDAQDPDVSDAQDSDDPDVHDPDVPYAQDPDVPDAQDPDVPDARDPDVPDAEDPDPEVQDLDDLPEDDDDDHVEPIQSRSARTRAVPR